MIAEDMRHVFLRTPEGQRVLNHLRDEFYDVNLPHGEELPYRAGQHAVVRYILDTLEDGK